MFDFKSEATTKADQWADVLSAADAVTAGEPDPVANMANVAAILFHGLPDLNWAGFYRMVGDELVLGPFQGKAACIRIAMGKGVCGAAAATGATQLVEDVHAFPGHIACDAACRAAAARRPGDRGDRSRQPDTGAVRRSGRGGMRSLGALAWLQIDLIQNGAAH
jgi:L-methionine (R)-S-oxide reductase